MEEMRRIAFQCAGRAFGFALLGNAVTMIGFSYDLALAVKIGAVLFGLTATVFLLLAHRAPWRDYRKTELWLWLPPDRRPASAHAQWSTGRAMQEAYLAFARHAGMACGGLAMLALLLAVLPG